MIGGRLKFFLPFWRAHVTSDPWVLALVAGVKIDFLSLPPVSLSRKNPQFEESENEIIDELISDFQSARVIREVSFSSELVVNPIFVVQNHNGSKRLILNSKAVNEECVPYVHFKLDTLHRVLACIKPGDWMTSHDLRKGYHNVALHPDHQRFFAFEWRGKFFVFQALPMGLREAPRLFTVIMKSLLTIPRAKGWRIFSYIDDTLLAASSRDEAEFQTAAMATLLTNAGFLLHEEKSVPVPTQQLPFLGFVIDSVQMKLILPDEKFAKMRRLVSRLKSQVIQKMEVTIRKFAQVIGFLLSVIPAVPYGEIHFRELEFVKVEFLKRGLSWDSKVVIPDSILEDLTWWLSLRSPVSRSFSEKAASHKIFTDASTTGGWGAICQGHRVAGVWSEREDNRIDLLEIRAVALALENLPFSWKNARILLKVDNTVAVSYLNNGGGRIRRLDQETRKIWKLLEQQGATLTAHYVPSQENPADSLTRLISPKNAEKLDGEWQLKPDLFSQVCDFFFQPRVDWFASAENALLPLFVSRFFVANAWETDALQCDWCNEPGYFFPPFCLLPRVVSRIVQHRVKAILIHPQWPSQIWWPDIINHRQGQLPLPTIAEALHLPGLPHLVHRLGRTPLVASAFNFR